MSLKFSSYKNKDGTYSARVERLLKDSTENYGYASGKTERLAMKALIDDLAYELRDTNRLLEKAWTRLENIKEIAERP